MSEAAGDGFVEYLTQTTPRKPGDWLQSLTSAERKEVAMSRGLKAYFPDALALIARHSVRSNQKHNPGQPVHWSREKSNDHEDCIERHGTAIAVDPDSLDQGEPHMVCRAWRALAALQEWAEKTKCPSIKQHGSVNTADVLATFTQRCTRKQSRVS